MRNYIILNGKNSNEINGLLIQELPPISKPLIRTEVEEIDGRDGDIVTPLGYSAYDKEFTIGLYKDFDVNEVAAYFNSEGTVIFSNEPDKYYYYQITAQIDFERLVRYRTATVTMHCQPFKYSATEQPITEDVSGTVSDEGTNLALENTAEAPFSKLDLKGNTEQTTLSGKNLLPIQNGLRATGGLSATYNSQTGLINVSGTATDTWPQLTDQFNLPQVIPSGSTVTLSMTEALPNGTRLYMRVYATTDATDHRDYAIPNNGTATTVTLQSNFAKTMFIFNTTSGTTINVSGLGIQLELGSTATDFEKFVGGTPSPNPDYPQDIRVVTGNNTVKITGKNLFLPSINSGGVLTKTYDSATGAYKITGTATGTWPWLTGHCYLVSDIPAGTTFIVSRKTASNIKLYVRYYYTDGTYAAVNMGQSTLESIRTAAKDVHSFVLMADTTAGEVIDETLYIQVEYGSTATDFEPYQVQSYPISLGSIELCGLGDDGAGGYLYKDGIYKNLENNKWYVHKEIGAYTFDGTENWFRSGRTSASVFVAANTLTSSIIEWKVGNAYRALAKSNRFTISAATAIGNFDLYNGTDFYTSIALMFDITTIPDITAAKAWITANKPVVYGILATPTDTEITNEALIEQLDDIYYHAHAYKGRTHITSSAATGNVPHIIAAEVGEDNESTITNAGNYLSKPKITVYGSGDISLYINDMHVLQITLGDEGYITIDTAQMEAYKDTLDNLKNRLVIGDYSNARLKPGANKIHFTGTVTKYVVENYSRWL